MSLCRSLGQQQIPQQQQQPKHRPPFDSGNYETRYDHYNHHHNIQRALTEGEINGSTASAGLFVPSNETLKNLFVEVNALFDANDDNDQHHQTPATGSGGAKDQESDDDGDNNDNRRRRIYHHQKTAHRKSPSKYKNNKIKNFGSTDDNDTKIGVQTQHDTTASKCQFRDLCEISLLGAAPNSHVVHRMLWTLANE